MKIVDSVELNKIPFIGVCRRLLYSDRTWQSRRERRERSTNEAAGTATNHLWEEPLFACGDDESRGRVERRVESRDARHADNQGKEESTDRARQRSSEVERDRRSRGRLSHRGQAEDQTFTRKGRGIKGCSRYRREGR